MFKKKKTETPTEVEPVDEAPEGIHVPSGAEVACEVCGTVAKSGSICVVDGAVIQ